MSSFIEIPSFDFITTQQDDFILGFDARLIATPDPCDNCLSCTINDGVLMITLPNSSSATGQTLSFKGLSAAQLEGLSDARDFILAALDPDDISPKNLWLCSSRSSPEMSMT